jgi:general secretion pathway protein D
MKLSFSATAMVVLALSGLAFGQTDAGSPKKSEVDANIGNTKVQLDLVVVSRKDTKLPVSVAGTNNFPGQSFVSFAMISNQEIGALLAEIKNSRDGSVARVVCESKLQAALGQAATYHDGQFQQLPATDSKGVTTWKSEPIGNQITFQPTLLPDGKLYLDLLISVCELVPDSASTVEGKRVLGRNRRTMNTTVVLEPGQSLTMSGLSRTVTTTSSNAPDFMAKVPLINGLFGVKENTSREEMFIVVTPQLIH